MSRQYNTYTLPNGLRVIHLQVDSPVVYCGYAIATGARHEREDQYGLAHFCEHMTFKGTEHLSSLQVINTLERVGGDLNAFTTKQDTFYYATVLRKDFSRAVRLLTDIVFHSTYPQSEIDKEVEVICDEIESYNDTPADLIYDEFENIISNNTPLGHNILGDADRVRRFTTEDARRFTSLNYLPDISIFYVHGNIDFQRLTRLLHTLHQPKHPNQPLSPSPYPQKGQEEWLPSSGQTIIKNIDSHQAHIMIGTAIPYDKSNVTLALLSNLLGGPSMNSRFNLALREKRGLVYSVDSTLVTYTDCYLWSTYLGCDPKDVNRCLRLIHSEIARLQRAPLSPTALNRAKQQLKGQLTLASENRENFAIDMAKQYLHRHTLKSNEELFSRIDAVTAADLQHVACEYLDKDRLTTLIMK